MWTTWIYCEEGHPQEGIIDDDGFVTVPDGCEMCEMLLMPQFSKLEKWRMTRRFKKELKREDANYG